jgi:hypothetical protein
MELFEVINLTIVFHRRAIEQLINLEEPLLQFMYYKNNLIIQIIVI